MSGCTSCAPTAVPPASAVAASNFSAFTYWVGRCPSCGRCPYCGGGGYEMYPIYPQPGYPGTAPIWPYSNPTVTC